MFEGVRLWIRRVLGGAGEEGEKLASRHGSPTTTARPRGTPPCDALPQQE